MAHSRREGRRRKAPLTAQQRADQRRRERALKEATPPHQRKDVKAKAPKRTPRLSEAEKREGRRKREARVGKDVVNKTTDAWWVEANYQHLAEKEVKRAAAKVTGTARGKATRDKERARARKRAVRAAVRAAARGRRKADGYDKNDKS